MSTGGFHISHAMGYGQFENVSFNNCHQATSVATTTTAVQVQYRGVTAQWDNTDASPAPVFFDFASDKANVIAESLRVTEVGGTVLAVGGGNSGFATLAGALVVGSRVDGGGYSAASPATNSPCFEVASGATLSMNTGVQDVLGSAGKAGPTFAGPGSVLKPAVVSSVE